ncbi:hypothetical protein BJ165DRAFT_1528514 [Panaeolus papilionaceus]|nr:hypothetical protein BJ165DRAFT_1528514 [Panaeolus papilionaceus]
MAQLSEVAQSDFPLTFECSTGELVFGQAQCIFEGLNSPVHLKRALPERLELGGTILQNKLYYRIAARSGTWKVSRIYSLRMVENQDGTQEERKVRIGFVVHHESVSAVEYLKRAAGVGINHNNTVDDGIVYVNRYDWAWLHGSRATINAALHPSRPWTTENVGSLMGGRLIVMDASCGNPFKDILRSSYLERKNYSFSAPGGSTFGVHVVAHPSTEYELGWVGFSGEKHATFPDSDEVVALVYDGDYHGLQLEDESDKLYAEDEFAAAGTPEQPSAPFASVLLNPPTASDDEEYATEPAHTTDGSDAETDPIDSDDDDDNYEDALEEGELASLSLPDQFPPPTILSVEPIWGLGLSIHGNTLRPTTVVEINDAPVQFEVASNELIRTRVPQGVSGKLTIRVHNPFGSSDVLTYDHPPVPLISEITPKTGSQWGGTPISIRGFFLSNVQKVLFDNVPALDLEHISDTQINVTAPASISGWNHSVRVSIEGEKTFFVRDRDLCAGNPNFVGLKYELEAPPSDGYAAAIKTFKWVLQEEPKAYEVRKRLSEAYDKMGDQKTRIALWQVAVELEGSNGSIFHDLASAFAANGEYEKALEAWNKALELGCDAKDLFLGMSEAYSKVGDEAKAEEMKADAERLWVSTMDY